ncbi:MAG: hypothetical protein P9C48_14315 [Defluviicoccus sp.]|nr:hypothetical protein [Defluviicoccus sp.]MDG4610293.1 hypothetical protein [Defluviicoccus sp.]
MKPLRYAAQAAIALITLGLIGYFSASPPYARVPAESALIKLSFAHAAEKKGGCRELSAEEIARLAPNMRRKTVCSRERLPVDIEVVLNGAPLYAERLPPTGLSGDGPSRAYQRFVVPAGSHTLVLKLRDSDRTAGFDYETTHVVTLAAGDSLAVDFFQGGFRFE